MSDKDDIQKAMAKMEAEAAKIEELKNRERVRLKTRTKVEEQKNRLEEIDDQNKEDHQKEVSKVKIWVICVLVTCLATLIYVNSLNDYQRSSFVQDVVIYSLALGLIYVAMLRK